MDYRRLCQVFIAEIRRLRQENESLSNALDWALDKADQERWRRCEERREERRRQERERELEETCRAIERDRAMCDLERARSWGDTWREEQALKRLRELL